MYIIFDEVEKSTRYTHYEIIPSRLFNIEFVENSLCGVQLEGFYVKSLNKVDWWALVFLLGRVKNSYLQNDISKVFLAKEVKDLFLSNTESFYGMIKDYPQWDEEFVEKTIKEIENIEVGGK